MSTTERPKKEKKEKAAKAEEPDVTKETKKSKKKKASPSNGGYTKEMEELEKQNQLELTEEDKKAFIELNNVLKTKHRKPADVMRNAKGGWSYDYYKDKNKYCVKVLYTIDSAETTDGIEKDDSLAKAATKLLEKYKKK